MTFLVGARAHALRADAEPRGRGLGRSPLAPGRRAPRAGRRPARRRRGGARGRGAAHPRAADRDPRPARAEPGPLRSGARRGRGRARNHLGELGRRAQSLEQGTTALTGAAARPTSRGRWGEVRLRRIVEVAGMLEHVDFSEQIGGTRADGEKGQRPDLVVHLSGERTLVVDAKAPMDAYLDAVEEQDPKRARVRRTAHARALRHHVDQIAGKAYWKALGDTPEFTVLFVPSDGVLAAALESAPDLLEHGFAKDVVIASPATLMAPLRTVAHTWRTDSLNRDAREVLEAGREPHHRLGTFTSHLGKVGRSLDSSVAAFNEAVGSLQSRVMVTARKFEDLGLAGTAVEDVERLTRRARTLEEDEIARLASPERGVESREDRSAG
ncbi:DNA recombination protein RmuC [Brachybacterium sp. GPGPB12]|uniref:DNA recombination protein RmuC n=1 Tax=Brachybacterium sp. GPGPB12 TaxID=3023517 RepID=UPI0031344625